MSSNVSKPERATQERVIELFTKTLGYQYLGDWSDRAGNHCIEEGLLSAFLARSGYSPAHINAALHKLRSDALLHGRSLYAANQAVYQLLRYGISVKVEAGQVNETVRLVNWGQPSDNDFAIAEEVTLKGGHERRPDIVLYLNGIAVGVLELKNSRVGLGEGIRQCLSNQQPEINFPAPRGGVFAASHHSSLRSPNLKIAASGGEYTRSDSTNGSSAPCNW